MQIVIDIDENVFTRLFDNGIEDYDIVNDDLFAIAKAIRKGTPLPKGHGRLIDADAYAKKYDTNINGRIGEEYVFAPTIIEADKEYEAKVITRGNCMMCGKELTEGLFLCKECEAKSRIRQKGTSNE